MKMKFVLLTALAAMSQVAVAQTSTTTVAPAAAGAANTNVATESTAAAKPAGVTPVIKYVGIMRGPGLEFNAAAQAPNVGGDDLNLEHRVSFLAKTSANFDFGVQARVNTKFGNGKDLYATSGTWRLLADIKHIYKDDVLDFTLTPRIMLPTSTKNRNQKLTLSPDVIADLTIAPKDSRFSFDTGVEYLHFLHTDGASGDDYTKALTAELAPWIEADFQLNSKTQLMVSYWPTFDAYARKGTPLATSSNEIDVGAYYEFVKGWQVNPYVATEMNAIGAEGASALQNMQFNVIVTGTVL